MSDAFPNEADPSAGLVFAALQIASLRSDVRELRTALTEVETSQSQVDELRSDIRALRAADEDLRSETIAAFEAVGSRLGSSSDVQERVEELEDALGFGPPFGSTVIDDIESCLSSIAAYLDARVNVFYCSYL